jgi:general stress protein YciG
MSPRFRFRSRARRGRRPRGFAAMDPERQRAIARKGGRASHRRGHGHEWTPEEAREAGRVGGRVAHRRGRAHEWTPEEAREAGRRGGRARWGRRSTGL